MIYRILPFALAIGCGASVAIHGEEIDFFEYRIEATISRFESDGEYQVISRPTLHTLERMQTSMEAGKATRVVIQDDEVVDAPTGVTCRFTPYPLKAGGVKLDMEIEIVQESEDMDKTIVTEKFGLRRIQQVPIGVRVEIPMACRGMKQKHRLELIVTESPRLIAEADDVPPPPVRIGRRDAQPVPWRPEDENAIQR